MTGPPPPPSVRGDVFDWGDRGKHWSSTVISETRVEVQPQNPCDRYAQQREQEPHRLELTFANLNNWHFRICHLIATYNVSTFLIQCNWSSDIMYIGLKKLQNKLPIWHVHYQWVLSLAVEIVINTCWSAYVIYTVSYACWRHRSTLKSHADVI